MVRPLGLEPKTFEKVANHLLTQNSRSVDALDTCLYRDVKGKRCAIGCLIEDIQYTEELEGKTVTNNLVVDALNASNFNTTDAEIGFYSSLQQIHDGTLIENWRRNLILIGRKYKLDCSFLELSE